jgi:hypothetical protein
VRAQRAAAAAVAIGLVAVCCAASISAGSASTSGSVSSVKALPDPGVRTTTDSGNHDGSIAAGYKVQGSRTSSTTSGQARSSKLRKREVFTVSEKETSFKLRVGTFNVRTARANDGRSWLHARMM